MTYFDFNTNGTVNSIALIVRRALSARNGDNQFDVEEKAECFTDMSGENCIRVFINETDFIREESFSHELIVEEMGINEYRVDLTLVY